MGSEGWGFTQINQAQRGGNSETQIWKSSNPTLSWVTLLPGSGFVVATSKNPEPKGAT